MEVTKERFTDFQERLLEIVSFEQREILKKKKIKRLRHLWGRKLIICVIRVPREENLVQKKIFEEIMADIFPNVV